MSFLRITVLMLLVALPLTSYAQREKLSPEDLAFVTKNWPNAQRTWTGLRTVLVTEGKGELAKAGDLVSVLYKGQLIDGKVFDQTADPTKPFTFRLGRGEVIQGWEEGIQFMRAGEKRILIIPYELGYGTLGDQPKIPKKAALIFDVELVSIKH